MTTVEESIVYEPVKSPTALDFKNQRKLRLKVDIRLCTIAALLASFQLLDSNIISSASVTSMLGDLGLDQGNRYSVAILIFTVTTVCFQLPATLLVRLLGPRIFFPVVTLGFGLVTICTAFIHSWKQMIIVRVLLGICTSGIYPGLAILISSWYRREELQLRFAYLQAGTMIVLATGGIVNWALNLQLDGQGGLKGWQWWVHSDIRLIQQDRSDDAKHFSEGLERLLEQFDCISDASPGTFLFKTPD